MRHVYIHVLLTDAVLFYVFDELYELLPVFSQGMECRMLCCEYKLSPERRCFVTILRKTAVEV